MKDDSMPPAHKEEVKDVHMPRAGMDTSLAFWRQPNRPLEEKSDYARSTVYAKNVRGYDAVTGRDRGGSRPGLSRFMTTRPGDVEFITQELTCVVKSGGTPVQTSQSGRVVMLVAVSQGEVYYANAGETVWRAAANSTGETPALNFTGIVRSAANQQKLWFADGINYVYFNPASGHVRLWEATAGSLPVDASENTPRLICTWRGCTVLSGLLEDGQNWFISAVDDPTDFDYAPLSPSPQDAVAGNNGPAGLVGDLVTGLVPYTDDVLIIPCDHSIYIMRGHPLSGGQIDCVSNTIGFAWGEAWCLDPYGNVYFFSNRMGIYRMVPGQQPERISGAIDSALFDIDTGANGIRLLWDDRFQGFHVFVTPLDVPTATTHFFYESRSRAWWSDEFANENLNPLCACVFDGNLPTDRATLVGSWDGYVRSIDPTALDDDGTEIASEVWIGPFVTANLDEMILKDLQAVLGDESGDVTFGIYTGKTAEEAFNSTPILEGTWRAGRNYNNLIRKSGHALYARITSTNPWALESIRMRMATTGKVRQRGQR